jgi:leucyl-tRNA synthetase
MSKSAGDAGDPQHLMNKYGADAVRMAMMFAAPPEQSFEWSEHGVDSASRWLRRLWKMAAEFLVAEAGAGPSEAVDPQTLNEAQKDLRRIVHETINKAADDYGRRLTFNTVVSAVMSMINAVAKFEDHSPQGQAIIAEALNAAVLILSPITPHICHRLWQELNQGQMIEDAVWPDVDHNALEKRLVQLVIQVNGKLRGKLEASPGATQESVAEMARDIENVSKYLQAKEVRKVIFVPDKLINFVVG